MTTIKTSTKTLMLGALAAVLALGFAGAADAKSVHPAGYHGHKHFGGHGYHGHKHFHGYQFGGWSYGYSYGFKCGFWKHGKYWPCKSYH